MSTYFVEDSLHLFPRWPLTSPQNHQRVNLLVWINQLLSFFFYEPLAAYCNMTSAWLSFFSRIPKRHKARNLRRRRIYDTASTESRSLIQTLITQEPSSGLARSRCNLTLFIKRVTVNRRVLSEWQFNFRLLNYPLVFKRGANTVVFLLTMLHQRP